MGKDTFLQYLRNEIARHRQMINNIHLKVASHRAEWHTFTATLCQLRPSATTKRVTAIPQDRLNIEALEHLVGISMNDSANYRASSSIESLIR